MEVKEQEIVSSILPLRMLFQTEFGYCKTCGKRERFSQYGSNKDMGVEIYGCTGCPIKTKSILIELTSVEEEKRLLNVSDEWKRVKGKKIHYLPRETVREKNKLGEITTTERYSSVRVDINSVDWDEVCLFYNMYRIIATGIFPCLSMISV